LQTYLYFRNYPKDPKYIKLLVFGLWILDTLQLTLCATAMYWYLITNYNKPTALEHLTWSMELQTDCNGVIALLVECFFARRVWIMSSNKYLVSLIVMLAAVHFGLGIVFTVYSFQMNTIQGFNHLIWVTSAGIGSATAADLLIAGALCFYLHKSRTGFKKTDSLISVLIVYTVSTGLITSIIGIAIVVTFAMMPNEYVWLALFWIDGKCYVNSCLAALNCRESLRERAAPLDGSFLHWQLSPLQNGSLDTSRSRSTGSRSDRLAIRVQTNTIYNSDFPESPSNLKSPSSALTDSDFNSLVRPKSAAFPAATSHTM